MKRALAIVAGCVLLAGCGSKKPVRVALPPPPEPSVAKTQPLPPVKVPSVQPKEQVPGVAPDAQALLVETGIASWYGAPYHNRKGSNGEVYDMNALTAAHRTLPLGSRVRVTNVATGNTVVVRITDRGPFVPGRIIDLSLAAAREVDLVKPGTATVKIEVLETPAPLAAGGRWAVQIGAFQEEDSAAQVQDKIQRRYHTARVVKFPSPVGDWWVRVRVQNDDKHKADEVARDTRTDEGAIFLVRLD
jgi:peptidoglycan lytic transglycosylase